MSNDELVTHCRESCEGKKDKSLQCYVTVIKNNHYNMLYDEGLEDKSMCVEKWRNKG